MRKVVVGLFVALIVAAGGYFGLAYWAEAAAIREVDAALDRWRASSGTATRGPVEVGLWTRAVKVSNVVLASQASPDDKISIAQVVASGIDTSGGAGRIEIAGLDMSSTVPGLPGARLRQRTPRVTLTGYSRLPPTRHKEATLPGAMRIWLEQFSAIRAEAIAVPTITVTVTLAGDGGKDGPRATEYTYSNLMLRDVDKGRVTEATVDGIALRSNAGRRALTGEIGKTSISDIDVGPLLAILDSSRPRGEGYQRVYGRLSAGPYTLRFGDGAGMTVDRIVAEDIGLDPAKFSLDDIAFLAEVGNAAGKMPAPTPAQLGMLVDKIADLYEVVRLGKLEMQGVRINALQEQISIGSLAIHGLENGRFAEIAVEKIEGKTPARDLLNAGRMSLKGFHVANLFRTTATQLTAPPRPGDPTQVLRALALLEGIEIEDLAIPGAASGRMMHLEALNATWGQLVEGIPSQARLSARLRVPISAADPEPFMRALAARGISAVTASLDVGSSWREAERTVVLAPATFEIGDFVAMSLKASLGNVPRDVFSADLLKAIASIALVEAGPVEMTVRDLGAVDQAAADMGRTSGGGPEAGRTLLAASLAQKAAAITETRPELRPFFDALTQFVQGKGQTITVALTPKGRLGVVPLIEDARRDPLAAVLAGFTLEARTGK